MVDRFPHAGRERFDIFMKEMLYEVRYLKSSEDMILALAGQFNGFESRWVTWIFQGHETIA